jgi:hypothetical protein
VVTDSWEPAYFFGRAWLYRLFLLLHRLLPRALGTASIFILHKRDEAGPNGQAPTEPGVRN